MAIIYLVTHRASGLRYVGATTHTLKYRWMRHVDNARRGGYGALARAIVKDGKDAFALELLEPDVPFCELGTRERAWIERLGTKAPAGFNGNAGGALGRHNTSEPGLVDRIVRKHGVTASTAKRWIAAGRSLEIASTRTAHGASGTPAFHKWHDMRACGGVADEWKDFASFAAFHAEAQTTGGQIRRRDKSAPWGPENCYLTPTSKRKSRRA